MAAALRACQCRWWSAASPPDRLYRCVCSAELAELLPGCDRLDVIESDCGHDGFLIETDADGAGSPHPRAGRPVAIAPPFGAQAAAPTEQGRPSYPPEAIDWLLPADARDVLLDLGAGTGKLTTRLVERGLNVVGRRPIAEMLRVLSHALPQTPAPLGTAEEIPVPTTSVDAVLSGTGVALGR